MEQNFKLRFSPTYEAAARYKAGEFLVQEQDFIICASKMPLSNWATKKPLPYVFELEQMPLTSALKHIDYFSKKAQVEILECKEIARKIAILVEKHQWQNVWILLNEDFVTKRTLITLEQKDSFKSNYLLTKAIDSAFFSNNLAHLNFEDSKTKSNIALAAVARQRLNVEIDTIACNPKHITMVSISNFLNIVLFCNYVRELSHLSEQLKTNAKQLPFYLRAKIENTRLPWSWKADNLALECNWNDLINFTNSPIVKTLYYSGLVLQYRRKEQSKTDTTLVYRKGGPQLTKLESITFEMLFSNFRNATNETVIFEQIMAQNGFKFSTSEREYIKEFHRNNFGLFEFVIFVSTRSQVMLELANQDAKAVKILLQSIFAEHFS